MNESRSSAALDGKSNRWNYTPPRWWRVSVAAVPFAIFAEAIALIIAIEPHSKLPAARMWGVAFCVLIPGPLIWLRNGNRHFKNLIARQDIDPAVLKLITYFSVGIVVASYLIIALLIANLYLALKLAN